MTRPPRFRFISSYRNESDYMVHDPDREGPYRISFLRSADPADRSVPMPQWIREVEGRFGFLIRHSNPDMHIRQDVFQAFCDWYRSQYDDEPPIGTARAVLEPWPVVGWVFRRWDRRDRDGNPLPDHPDPLQQPGPTVAEIEDAAAAP